MNVTKGRCRLCIQTCNVDWSIDDDLWDKVMNDESGTLRMKYGVCICMTCFVKLAIKMGLSADRWRLSLDPDVVDENAWAKNFIRATGGAYRYRNDPPVPEDYFDTNWW